jgi:phospholipid/cholesterol/gamma-HCH transport system substrate-binding protein
MDLKQRDTLLGLVAFATLAFLLWATVSLTDLSFNNVPPLLVYFHDVSGVRNGDPVRLLGKPIGKVGNINYLKGRPSAERMQLELNLHEAVQLAVDYTIEIQDTGVLGGKQVQIDPGSGEPLKPGTELIGTASGNPFEFFNGKGPAGVELKGALEELRALLHNANDPETTIGAVMRRRDLYDVVLSTMESLNHVMKKVENGDGLLGRVIADTTLRDDFMTFVSNLRDLSERLRGTGGVLPRLLNDNEMGQHMASLLENLAVIVADTKDGKGVIGALLRDPELTAQLRTGIANLNDALRRLNDPDAGVLGRLLADADMSRSFKNIVLNLESVSAKLNEGKGMLGVLLNDEDLGVRFRRIMTQISRALEDAREAAPIANFVTVLIGAF